jgi:hypothetical protein
MNPEGGPVTTSEFEPTDGDQEPRPGEEPERPRRGFSAVAGAIASRVASRRFVGRCLALAAVAAVIVGAYVVGAPGGSTPSADAHRMAFVAADQAAFGTGGVPIDATVPMPAATAAPAMPVDGTGKSIGLGTTSSSQDLLAAPLDTTQIVKTGQLALEVADLDKAVTQGQAAINGIGGYVNSSNRSGTDDSAIASVTYRLPVARWDDALASLRKLGSKTLSEQTDTTDVTSQVIDLQARLDNLKVTETALQAIMAKAVAIPDVIAVETQLSQTEGEIEQLTAQRNHLSDQAAMSTLTVTFQLPGKTVTTQATQDWTLGSQVDEAAAALVRIGQGLATIVVWILVVVLPVGLGALVLLAILALTRRILGRGRRRDAATTA